jgi:hypothetical protein
MIPRAGSSAARTALHAVSRVAAVATPGAAAIWVAAAGAPNWSRPLLVTAAVALTGSTAGRWPWTGTLAAATIVALAGCAAAAAPQQVSAPTLAVDGLLVLAYLLILDAVETSRLAGRTEPVLRGHLPAFAAGSAAATVATLGAAAPARPAPILAVAGAAALAAAYMLAIHPAVPTPGTGPRQPVGSQPNADRPRADQVAGPGVSRAAIGGSIIGALGRLRRARSRGMDRTRRSNPTGSKACKPALHGGW